MRVIIYNCEEISFNYKTLKYDWPNKIYVYKLIWLLYSLLGYIIVFFYCFYIFTAIIYILILNILNIIIG